MNAYPQFRAEIEGVPIQSIHVLAHRETTSERATVGLMRTEE